MIPLSQSPWRSARWLILAPHADDETLGTGALIADTAAGNRLGAVAILTDGSGSQPCPTPADRTRLIRQRRQEASRAVRILADGKSPTLRFLDWPDAHPSADGSAAFLRSAATLAAMIRRLRIDAIATTALGEPHCDHSACYRLAAHVVRTARRPVSLFAYTVWGTEPRTRRILQTGPITSGHRTAALRMHRSQLFGQGFRLPRSKQRMKTTDLLYLMDAHARRP
ncbi:PIG-L family deacetylase [Sphingomonas mollis]|uniref:PIG-L deacetylase family protein n=1 Tax=Sphingomonas mollis TaxID=2795726 RepID=UPI002FCDEA27